MEFPHWVASKPSILFLFKSQAKWMATWWWISGSRLTITDHTYLIATHLLTRRLQQHHYTFVEPHPTHHSKSFIYIKSASFTISYIDMRMTGPELSKSNFACLSANTCVPCCFNHPFLCAWILFIFIFYKCRGIKRRHFSRTGSAAISLGY